MRRATWLIRRGGAFFRPDAAGYTTHIVAAGLYTREEADRYADVEGVTIHPVEEYRAEAERTIAEAQRILAALSTPTTPDEGEAEGPFAVSSSSDGVRHWFSARDAAAGVTIPAASRVEAYALVSSLNRAIAHHVTAALRQPGAEYRRGVEDAARVAVQERDLSGKDFHDAFTPQDGYIDACHDIEDAIRALSDSIPDTKGGGDGE